MRTILIGLFLLAGCSEPEPAALDLCPQYQELLTMCNNNFNMAVALCEQSHKPAEVTK